MSARCLPTALSAKQGMQSEQRITKKRMYAYVPAATLAFMAISVKPNGYSSAITFASNERNGNSGARASNISFTMGSLAVFLYASPYFAMSHGTRSLCTAVAFFLIVNSTHGPTSAPGTLDKRSRTCRAKNNKYHVIRDQRRQQVTETCQLPRCLQDIHCASPVDHDAFAH